MTKMSTQEAVRSRIFMIAVSRDAAGPTGARLLDQVMEAAKGLGSPDEPVYDIRLSANGVELDFAEFEREILRQLNELVVDAAGRLLKEALGDTLDGMARRATEAVEELVKGIRKEAADKLGYNPWQYEDEG